MLRYWAATALFQEVKLLNRYVRDAAINGDYVPYVLRFNVAFMPLRRHLPLDTYVNLSVFLGKDELGKAGCAKHKASCKLPLVLPLLVTDDIEAALHARSREQLHTLALALSGMLEGIGLEGDLSHFDDALQRVLGRDLNSLMMVSRLTTNTLRVRFGAMQETQSDYAMVPRNQFVTAVVLVPKSFLSEDKGKTKDSQLSVWTSTQFVRIKDGTALREKSASKDNKDVQHIAANYKVSSDQVAKAWEKVVDGDWKGFAGHFSANPTVMLRELWLDIAQLQAGYSFDNFTVDLPPYAAPSMVPKQVAFLHDDGKANTSVQLTGGSDLDARTLCAKLVFGGKTSPTNVLPNKVSVTGGGTEIDLEFPSLKAWGLNNVKASDRHLFVNEATDPATCWNPVKTWQRELDTRYRLVQPAPPDVGFKVSILSGVVVEKDGKGTFRFELTQAKQDPVDVAIVNVTGGDISSISTATRDLKGTKGPAAEPTSQPATGADFAVHLEKGKVTIVTLGLENLKAGAKVQTSFKNAHGAKTTGKDVPIQKDGS